MYVYVYWEFNLITGISISWSFFFFFLASFNVKFEIKSVVPQEAFLQDKCKSFNVDC